MDHLTEMSLKPKVHTFGCKINLYDSGWVEKNLSALNLKHKVHVLNTCAVTSEATKEAKRLIRKLKIADPFCKVVVTGCAAQVDTDQFNEISGADLVVANSHKSQLRTIIEDFLNQKSNERIFKSNIFKKTDLEDEGGLNEGRTRSFLKIQDGCNSFCTFCVIPYARGKSRSLAINFLTQKVNELHAQGYQEVILTGVHIGDYFDDSLAKNNGLEDLVEALLNRTKIPRLRLTSLEPIEVTDKLLELYKDDRLCKHFHMSIQSSHTDVLSAMKRKYTTEQVVQSLNEIQNKCPGAFVGMDVIAGFPSETDEQFNESFKILQNAPWTRLHVFPYSERPGTWAQKNLKTLAGDIVKARAKKLRDLSDERYSLWAQNQVGTSKKVLLLNGKESITSLSRDNWSVEIPQELIPNALKDREISNEIARGLEWNIKVGAVSGRQTQQRMSLVASTIELTL